MEKNAYIEDILSQPQALRDAVKHYDPGILASVARDVQSGKFDRIVITGMGASLHGMIPAWLRLVERGLPAWLVESSELLNSAIHLVTPRTLFWAVSQSGKSAEIQALISTLGGNPPALTLGTSNDLESPLARGAGICLPLRSGAEFTVSTRSYVNTLAVCQLAALQLTGQPIEGARADLLAAADGIERYLDQWETHVEMLAEKVGVPERLMILGRGDSLATTALAPLMLKESAKYLAEGISAAQFRHGPLEMADPRLTVLFLEGPAHTRQLNLDLAAEVKGFDARVFWLSQTPNPDLETLALPAAQGAGCVLAEIIPFQMLSLSISAQTHVAPGIFRHIGKVTEKL